jgi:hypothetical protein
MKRQFRLSAKFICHDARRGDFVHCYVEAEEAPDERESGRLLYEAAEARLQQLLGTAWSMYEGCQCDLYDIKIEPI